MLGRHRVCVLFYDQILDELVNRLKLFTLVHLVDLGWRVVPSLGMQVLPNNPRIDPMVSLS